MEKIYFVLDGEMTIKTLEEKITPKALASIFIGTWEDRKTVNKTNMPGSMLVIINYPS